MGNKHVVSRLSLMRFDQELLENKEWLEKFSEELRKSFPEKNFEEMVAGLWNSKKLEKMSTEEILQKLSSLDITFDEEKFKNQAQNYISAIELADECYYPEEWDDTGFDDDFVWLAIIELWKRTLPEQYNVEMVDDALYNGYKLIGREECTEGLKEWERAWTMIKHIFPSTITSVEEADDFMPFPLTQSLFNWCQDVDDELYKRGIEDVSYFVKRIAYNREFCQRFPDTGDSVVQHMLKAEAESYYKLGDLEKAETCFQQLVERFPDYVWGYAGWGDIYWLFDEENPDYPKAEGIYQMGIVHCTAEKEKDILYERLESVKRESKKEKSKK